MKALADDALLPEMTNLYDELAWRGMMSESTEGLSDLLARESVTAYIGFDPSAAPAKPERKQKKK